jgi:hypothetical protein
VFDRQIMRLFEFETGHTGVPNANDTTADPQTAPAESETSKVNASAGMSAEAWRMYARIYNDTEKTQLCDA